jgi:hypothetical protein
MRMYIRTRQKSLIKRALSKLQAQRKDLFHPEKKNLCTYRGIRGSRHPRNSDIPDNAWQSYHSEPFESNFFYGDGPPCPVSNALLPVVPLPFHPFSSNLPVAFGLA